MLSQDGMPICQLCHCATPALGNSPMQLETLEFHNMKAINQTVAQTGVANNENTCSTVQDRNRQDAVAMPPLPTEVANNENTVQDRNQASQALQRDNSNRQFEAAVSSALTAQDGFTKGEVISKKLEGGSYLVLWTLHDGMLKSKNTHVTSKHFTIENATFSIIAEADLSFLAKNGRSFDKAKGNGFGKLRCISGSCCCKIGTMICSRDQSKMQKPRGPFFHNFAEHTVAGGSGYDWSEWNFKDAVDFASKTFVLAFEIELLPEDTVNEAR